MMQSDHMDAVLEKLGQKTDLSAGVAVPVTQSHQVIANGARVLLGFAVKEATGTAEAFFRLHDGTSAAGPSFGPVQLAQKESVREWFADQSIEITSGALYLEMVTGTIEGVVFWG